MADEKVKKEYADMIVAAKKKWDESSPELKEAFYTNIATRVEGFLLWWDTLKAIEKKFNIDVTGIAWEERWKHSYATGQAMGKNYKEHGMKELYDACMSPFEGMCEQEFLELNDEGYSCHVHHCPHIQFFRDAGRSDEEIKEMAPLFCLKDVAILSGFSPGFDVFHQTRLQMKGDPWCNYRAEDNRAKERRLKEQKGK